MVRRNILEEKKQNKPKMTWQRKLILIISLCVLAFCAYKLIPKLMEYGKSRETYEHIREDVVKKPEKPEKPAADSETETVSEVPDDSFKIDWEKFKGENVVAWLQLDDIGYPVMQGKDNEQYLHTLPDGTYNYGGSIFLEAKNKSDFTDQNSIIYGHNMADGSMFGKFRSRYGDAKYKDHTFDLYLPDGTRHTYTFFAVVLTTGGSDVYTYRFGSEDQFLTYQTTEKEMSLYKNSAKPDPKAHLVSLSTCNGYEGTNNRLVIQGIETGVKKTQDAASWWKPDTNVSDTEQELAEEMSSDIGG